MVWFARFFCTRGITVNEGLNRKRPYLGNEILRLSSEWILQPRLCLCCGFVILSWFVDRHDFYGLCCGTYDWSSFACPARCNILCSTYIWICLLVLVCKSLFLVSFFSLDKMQCFVRLISDYKRRHEAVMACADGAKRCLSYLCPFLGGRENEYLSVFQNMTLETHIDGSNALMSVGWEESICRVIRTLFHLLIHLHTHTKPLRGFMESLLFMYTWSIRYYKSIVSTIPPGYVHRTEQTFKYFLYATEIVSMQMKACWLPWIERKTIKW